MNAARMASGISLLWALAACSDADNAKSDNGTSHQTASIRVTGFVEAAGIT
jgi:hypothetical protein